MRVDALELIAIVMSVAAGALQRIVVLVVAGVIPCAAADEAVQPDTLRSYATLHSLGFEYDLRGDVDHDASCAVRYRPTGIANWIPALALFRIDYDGYYAGTRADRAYNMLAGSIFFLEPGTTYEVELTLHDPDGGGERRVVEVGTRAEPTVPVTAALYVHADTASGDGSRQRPLSMALALSAAKPGSVFRLLPGHYGQVSLTGSGEAGAPIAWLGPSAVSASSSDADDAVFERLQVSASHVWIEGFAFDRGQAWPDSVTRGGLRGIGPATDIVVRGNRFRNYHYSIWLQAECRAWVISDNTIVGFKDIEQEGNASFSGEGIELQHSSDHTVAYNSISQVADGISYAHRNVDIFGNDIFDTSDDGLEPDYGYANLRMWGNRIANVQHFAFSFQGMYCGPWYFLRNQVTTARGGLFKFRTTDRIVFVNNTLVAAHFGDDLIHHLLQGLVRNNLFIRDGREQSRQPWWARRRYEGQGKERGYFTLDWTAPTAHTDWDYSGYDLRARDGSPGVFHWFGVNHSSVEDLAAAVGIETHGRHVERQRIFADYLPPTHPARLPPPVLSLRQQGAAVDAGAPVANLADRFQGPAPDLGAFEFGGPAPHFGPRELHRRDRWLDPWKGS